VLLLLLLSFDRRPQAGSGLCLLVILIAMGEGKMAGRVRGFAFSGTGIPLYASAGASDANKPSAPLP